MACLCLLCVVAYTYRASGRLWPLVAGLSGSTAARGPRHDAPCPGLKAARMRCDASYAAFYCASALRASRSITRDDDYIYCIDTEILMPADLMGGGMHWGGAYDTACVSRIARYVERAQIKKRELSVSSVSVLPVVAVVW